MASYEDALRVVLTLESVRVSELSRMLNLEWSKTASYLARMEQEGVVSSLDVRGSRQVLRASAGAAGSAQPGKERRSTQESCEHQRISELEAQVERLKASGRIVIEQREHWKARALAAEKTTGSGSRAADEAGRYAALKRILARELHPDFAPGDGIEKLVREAIFKKVWPQVEDIEKKG